ncbi:hypothetical protein BT96DRAFT_1050171 [Gymnopus androsaceus JB14]|uniref:Uncharacterized protein n=1 Tax=Gymnopus androsaceus JB14 TaxID=1447944 RepID=A0A6A4H8W7_9AGAR|nr:hypothetical protein BT96DRAFT_1050171 [Gymnopus androsaceus JB14]
MYGVHPYSYDVHCKLLKTVKCSPLRSLAKWCRYLPVIGTMHSYTHEQKAQLLFLMLYIVGTRIEDGEACECYFAVTNALAGITCHQSIFHCCQAIAEFVYHHNNFKTYANSSLFIYNNDKQVLGILQGRHAVAKGMKEAGIVTSDTFYGWLTEEGEHLCSLQKVLDRETLEMEYFQKLEGLYTCVSHLKEATIKALPWKRGVGMRSRMSVSLLLTARCWSGSWRSMSIVERAQKWCATKKVREAAYCKALDKLERLLVSRIFEMTRLNVAGTGYKMWKHIINALKLRLKTIQSAITAYNEAVIALSPPCCHVSWEYAIEYSYLMEFNIL